MQTRQSYKARAAVCAGHAAEVLVQKSASEGMVFTVAIALTQHMSLYSVHQSEPEDGAPHQMQRLLVKLLSYYVSFTAGK